MRTPNVMLVSKVGFLCLLLLQLLGIITLQHVFMQSHSSRYSYIEQDNNTDFIQNQSLKNVYSESVSGTSFKQTELTTQPNFNESIQVRIGENKISHPRINGMTINTVFFKENITFNESQIYRNKTTSSSSSDNEIHQPPLNVTRSFIFKGANKKALLSFYNVCIEAMHMPIHRIDLLHEYQFIETKKLVIYNSPKKFVKTSRGTVQRQTISVAGPESTHWNHWDVYFTNKSIPLTHMIHSTTAFFIAETLASNLYHFWNEQFVNLYSVIRETNGLHHGIRNQILYRYPKIYHTKFPNDTNCPQCRHSPFDMILRTLHTTNKFYVFYELPTNTCYTSAVFGTRYNGRRLRDSIDHVLAQFNLTYKTRSRNKTIIIVERSNRRLLNTNDLVSTLEENKYLKVKVINFAEMTVMEQLRTIVDTDILIGVQGAALQWAIFMSPKSTLVEISWPEKHWRSMYSFVGEYGIRHHEVATDDVLINWTSYEEHMRRKTPFSPEERQHILESEPPTGDNNVWKFCDVRVDVNKLKKLLSKVK